MLHLGEDVMRLVAGCVIVALTGPLAGAQETSTPLGDAPVAAEEPQSEPLGPDELPTPLPDSSRFTTGEKWRFWNNLRVNASDGTCFFDSEGANLRAQEIKVYADDVKWWPGHNSPVVRSVEGTKRSAGPPYRYPQAYAHSIIIYQRDGKVFQVFGTRPENATTMVIENSKNICTNVNDTWTDPTYYRDNGGSYDLHILITKK
jgi:hypothetical protein